MSCERTRCRLYGCTGECAEAIDFADRMPWFEEAAPISPEAWAALTVPNRLYGAEINHRGEAI